MNVRLVRTFVAVASAAVLLPVVPAAAAPACTWTASALPTIDNAGGFVLGTDGDHRFAGYMNDRPAVWVPGRVVVLSQQRGVAQDVNRSGLAVGVVDITRAVLWRGQTAVTLAVPRGQAIQEVTAINDAGIIVGNTWVRGPDGNVQPHGLVWNARTPWHVLDVTPAHHYLWLSDVSDRGVLAGTIDPYPYPGVHWPHAVIGTLHSGFHLIPAAPSDTTSALASTGRYVAGYQNRPGVWAGPVVWVDGFRPLRIPGGGTALAVNSHLQVAGLGLGGPGAWVWDHGVRTELPGPEWQPYVTSITEHGEVGGNIGGTPTVWNCR